MLSRRDFLAVSAALGLSPAVSAFATAAPQAAASPVLVNIFLRGGMDALSLIAPVDDPNYMADRAPEIRLLADGPKPALRLSNAPKGLDFRLHPDASPLLDLYSARRLAVVHATGISNGTRSHFGAQELIERGLANPEDVTRIQGGWIARWLAATGAAATPAVSTSPSAPASLETHADIICAPDLRGGLSVPGGKPSEAVLARLYPSAGGLVQRAAYQTLSGVHLIDHRLRGPDGKVQPYVPQNGAQYDESEIGRSLQTAARVMRMDLPIRAFSVDMGGWDTHENQPGRFSALAGQLSRAMFAFHTDMADRLDRTVLIVMSEFGRRLRSNKSNGTDHGHGGVMLISAPGIHGGMVHGRWPGLKSEELDNRVDLAVTTDIRSTLAELMRTTLQSPQAPGLVFPGYKPEPVGLV